MDLSITIMAGGAGTRFWPLSTEERPKQFLALTEERSLLQISYDRLLGLVPVDRILVLTNERYTELVAEQLPELPAENIIGEPVRRDTAAAVALAALLTQHRFGQVAMGVVTADHWISPLVEFEKAMRAAATGCESGGLYTFGIRPTYPATSFGYLEMAEKLSAPGDLPHFRVSQFKEKPDPETAAQFLSAGNYFWNSGMFMWSTSSILAEFEAHLPAHLETLDPYIQGRSSLAACFDPLEKISVDYAILERAKDVRAVVPNYTWNDVGSWHAVEEFLPEAKDGVRSRGKVESRVSSRSSVFCEDPEEQVVLIGAEDLIVVRSGNRTLVVHRDQLDHLKEAVQSLQ